ncbi:hypothetical protein C8R31_101670 [Nitrosospira sp. Nsp2]|uniref:hypothetical protein n=1 Tax=Nitrosospira sp. Nsp2 TaxID=136548 RepID=UPI000D319826|nr:hypothetical protein [Nitrosospira sp. Nsp2]PTR17506.1 hypothetical protein C8R31_101670 [Nitrosospira sp. Nsp2]
MNIGTMTIEMVAKLSSLERDMNRAKGIVAGAMGDIQKSANLVSGALGLIGVGLSAGAFAAYAHRVVDTLATIDDAAQKTGSSVENLSRIEKTARAFGANFGDIDSALVKLARGIATVDDESNRTNQALRALGLSSRDAAGNLRDPSEVLIEIAKRLQNYQDGANKSAIVTDLFGKSGANLLPVLNDLAENVDKFGSVSAASAAEAARFQDQMGLLKGKADEALTSFSLGLLPALNRITGAMQGSAGGMNVFTAAGRSVGSMLEFLLVKGSAVWMLFGNMGDAIGTRARQLIAIVKGDFHEVGQLQKNLDNEIGKRIAEHQHYVSTILGGNQQVEKSTQSVKPQLNYLSGAIDKSGAVSGYERATKAATDYINKLREETEAVGLNAVQMKLLGAAREAAKAPLESQRAAIMESAQAWAMATQAQEESAAAAKAIEAEEKKRLDGYAAMISADEKALQSLQEKNNLLEYGASAVAAMGQADLQAALDRAWAADNIDINVIAMLERRLELSKQLAAEAKRGEALTAVKEAAKAASDAWQHTARDINRSLTDALLRGFESGKTFAQNLRDTMVHMFQTTILRPVIDLAMAPVSRGMAGVMGALGFPGTGIAGTSSAAGNSFNLMNLASGAKSIFSAFTGGASSLVTSIATSAIGQAMGLGVAGGSALGAGVGIGGVGAGAGAGTAFIGGAGTALGGTGATVAGLTGMGSMLAAAAGPLAIAAAADMIFRLIAGNKTIKGAEALTYVPVIGPLINMLFGMGPKKLGPQELTGKFSDQGFDGQFEADWTRKGGLFAFGKKKGRRGLGISAEQDAALDAMVGDISGAFLSLTKTTGDAGRSLAGWTFEVKRAIDTEEKQEELTKDLSNSIGSKLIPELTLIQQKGEELADTAARASAEFTLVNSILDLTGKSLAVAGLASLGLRDSLVQLLGGIENAGSALQPFFENFYTDAERVASTGRLMNAEMSKLGITTLPTTRAQFRALVEAQDLNTDAGQKMFAALIQLAPAFVTVTDAIAKAADDAAAEAKRIADSIQLLTTDAFATLFDYTRYIRLAANAGVTAAQPAGPVYQAPGQVFLPGFASGSNEIPHDMTARIHKGERILPAADNRELMRRLSDPGAANDALVDEIRQLRAELKAVHVAMATNTSKTARNTEKMLRFTEEWDVSGLPPERAA